jgi:hypothetical protein
LNEDVSTIHDYMPVILAPDDYDRWLRERMDDRSTTAIIFEQGIRGTKMENYAGWIGIAIAIALRGVLWKSGDTLPKKIAMTVVILLVSGVSAFTASYGTHWLRRELSKPDRIEANVAQFRTMPLIGAVLRDNPAAEAAIRDAVRLDVTDNTFHRSREKIVELRRTYVAPAIMAASDTSVTEVWTARMTLMRHLQATNGTLCREFFECGIQYLNTLDQRGKDLHANVVKALEAVYFDGKGKLARSKSLDENDFAKLFEILAFSPVELQRLGKEITSSDGELCAVGVKLYEGVLTKLHKDSQPRVIRSFLAQS